MPLLPQEKTARRFPAGAAAIGAFGVAVIALAGLAALSLYHPIRIPFPGTRGFYAGAYVASPRARGIVLKPNAVYVRWGDYLGYAVCWNE